MQVDDRDGFEGGVAMGLVQAALKKLGFAVGDVKVEPASVGGEEGT